MFQKLSPSESAIGLALAMVTLAGLGGPAFPAENPANVARTILGAVGAKGGLVVHLGCGDGRLTAALHASDAFLVHGLDRSGANVRKARNHIRSLGLYGNVSVERLTARRLPYADDLVNLLVVSDPCGIPDSEMMRVVAPGGAMLIEDGGRWRKRSKPRPPDIDDWTHYLYDASGNAVSRDRRVGPPRYVQWIADPRYIRHHDALATVSAMVSANGRLLYIADEAPASLTHLPGKWSLIARDAFSGVLLWKRAIARWVNNLWPFRAGPFDLPRRLVAAGDRLYVTLGYQAPISCLDAATGETLRLYEGTAGAEELILHDGVLIATLGRPGTRKLNPSSGGRRGRTPLGPGLSPATTATAIVAIEAASGKTLWKLSGQDVAGLYVQTLAASGDRVVYKTDYRVRCVELRSGRRLWQANVPTKGLTTLVVADGLVLVADSSTITALDLTDGRKLWSGPCAGTFHVSPDVFVIDGLVWAGTGRPDRKYPLLAMGRDLRTGQVKRRLDLTTELWSTVAHHRCHKCKATTRYILTSQRGVEFLDLHGTDHYQNNWIRATCQLGLLPANGLLYFPPHSCGCFAKGKVNGFFATASRRQEVARIPPVLEKGPAFGQRARVAVSKGDWPTFRHDPLRSGTASSPVSSSGLRVAWQTSLGARPSTMTVAGGRLYVAAVDHHTLHCLEAATAKRLWAFTAGGRVDSPPTIHDGLALFGCADGWLYCVRADTGELVWRYRAAPDERRVVCRDQLESAWPCHGAVLVLDDLAYVAAGRSSYLDGGIRLCALEPRTGKLIHEATVASKHLKYPDVSYQEHIRDATLADVLISDGTDLYMRMMRFDPSLRRQGPARRHLFAVPGLLDPSWHYRMLWMYDDDRRMPGIMGFEGPKSYYVNHPYNPERSPREWLNFLAPAGQLLAIDGNRAFGIRAIYDVKGFQGQTQGCRIYRMDLVAGRWQRKWIHRVPIQFRAMVLAGEALYLAGWPDVPDKDYPWAAADGRHGGILWAVSAATGEKLAESKLPAAPVFDGMVAAAGRLFIACRDGRILCLGSKSQ